MRREGQLERQTVSLVKASKIETEPPLGMKSRNSS